VSLVAIIYGAFVAMAQSDLKKLIAYSSVNHMGYVTLGCAVAASASASEASKVLALNGAQMQVFSHGLLTGALFLLVGVVYERSHTRDLSAFGGLGARVPVYAGMLTFCSLGSLGLPGMTGFIAELSVLIGTYTASPLVAGVALVGVVVTAAYMLWVLQRVILGPLNPKYDKMPDANGREIVSLAPLMALTLLFGVWPKPILDIFNAASQAIVKALH
jgi:NADH-quinone oxidoreductase subunit M